jgi:proteasome lid subunit RPN8/RPN11
LLHALRAADSSGEKLLVIYHSHVDTAAYLSHTDLAGALDPDGEPLYPGSAQLVVSVHESGVGEAALFVWDSAERVFRGRAAR